MKNINQNIYDYDNFPKVPNNFYLKNTRIKESTKKLKEILDSVKDGMYVPLTPEDKTKITKIAQLEDKVDALIKRVETLEKIIERVDKLEKRIVSVDKYAEDIETLLVIEMDNNKERNARIAKLEKPSIWKRWFTKIKPTSPEIVKDPLA